MCENSLLELPCLLDHLYGLFDDFHLVLLSPLALVLALFRAMDAAQLVQEAGPAGLGWNIISNLEDNCFDA